MGNTNTYSKGSRSSCDKERIPWPFSSRCSVNGTRPSPAREPTSRLPLLQRRPVHRSLNTATRHGILSLSHEEREPIEHVFVLPIFRNRFDFPTADLLHGDYDLRQDGRVTHW